MRMERTDFVHLVHKSEQASAKNRRAYRRGVAVFATLGYAWVLGRLGVSLLLLSWVLGAWSAEPLDWHWGRWVGLVVSMGLLWATVRTVQLRADPPEGVEIQREDAPLLFESLDRIQRKIDSPPIHHVFLDEGFHARIRQWPRFGLWGGAVNTLNIGLPLLMALDRRRVLSLLTHEYAHLRGKHGRLSAWIYRTRLAWLRLDAQMQRRGSKMGQWSQAFLHWYFPRFAARTFAMARQDEYTADRVSARLLSPRVAAAAISEVAVKSQWLHQQLIPAHWGLAELQQQPVGLYSALKNQLSGPPPQFFARRALRSALRRVSDDSDTLPGLRERLDAWKVKPRLPRWSKTGALDMLAEPAQWVHHFDAQWCRMHRADWRQHHSWLDRLRERSALLQDRAERLSVDELVEWADLDRQRNPYADVRARYERALQSRPHHAGALRGLYLTLPPEERNTKLQLLQRLYDLGVEHRSWPTREAVSFIEALPHGEQDGALLAIWRERLMAVRTLDREAWEALGERPYLDLTTAHTLDEGVLVGLRIALANHKAVARAWVLKRELRATPWRQAHLLFVDVPELSEEDRYVLCRALERQLQVPGVLRVLFLTAELTAQDVEAQAKTLLWQRPKLLA